MTTATAPTQDEATLKKAYERERANVGAISAEDKASREFLAEVPRLIGVARACGDREQVEALQTKAHKCELSLRTSDIALREASDRCDAAEAAYSAVAIARTVAHVEQRAERLAALVRETLRVVGDIRKLKADFVVHERAIKRMRGTPPTFPGAPDEATKVVWSLFIRALDEGSLQVD